MDTSTLAKVLAVGGVVLLVSAAAVWLFGRAGGDRLPSLSVDVAGGRVTLLIGLSIVLSVIGTIVLNVLARR